MNNSVKLSNLIAVLILLITGTAQAQEKLTNYVDPMIGTDEHAHTFPGATVPNGMVQLSPDTGNEGWDWCSGYHYSDASIMGFSHTHLSGTGASDYGDILFMPTTGKLQFEPGTKENPDTGYRSRFSHKNETAEAGYYSVYLDDYKIKAELTVKARAGFHKYTFPESDESNIIIDLVHGISDRIHEAEIKFIDNKTIQGYRRSSGWARNHCIYFYAEFSKPFDSFGIYENGIVSAGSDYAKGSSVKAYINYKTASGETVLVKVGISHTSIDGAKKNLQAEIPDWDFDKIQKEADALWEQKLSSIKIDDKNKSRLNVFYTALYHAYIAPNIQTDVDGSYMGMDGKIHKIGGRQMYTVFSLWDTFRALHPLYTLIDPTTAEDLVQTLVKKYEEHGLLPVWELASNETGTMIGYHSIPVIADAYFKGLRNFDIEKAFEGMKKSAMQDHLGLKAYREMGMILSDIENESVSKTLEYAYDDWCIAMMAKDLGREDDYKYFIERAKFYVNLFDPSYSLMRPKKNGKWIEPFDPFAVTGNYTEANSWQYSFFVPQNISGLTELMGGEDRLVSKLDELFTNNPTITGRFQADITGLIGQYAHGNEPSHHMAYLYNYAGAPWKTQERVNEILKTLYNDTPAGLCGNEDCGQMSAWYVLSALGFYPVCPGDNNYIIGTPIFEKSVIKTGDDKYFIITAENLSDENIYIQSVKLNGKEYPYSYITHNDLVDGGEMFFVMGPKPSNWGSGKESRPVSKIDYQIVPVPLFTSGERVFRNELNLSLSTIDNTGEIYYTTDGSEPSLEKYLYSKPLIIDNTVTVKAATYKDGNFSKTVTANFNKIPDGRDIKLYSKYHTNYTGGGDLGLIDGIKGTLNFHTDAWQGYEGIDFSAVVDLGTEMKISSINVSFLQDTPIWIFFPVEVEYYISDDGENFTKIYSTQNTVPSSNQSAEIKNFNAAVENIDARYVKVFAKNLGVCPDWHLGAGGKTWIFIDEIEVN